MLLEVCRALGGGRGSGDESYRGVDVAVKKEEKKKKNNFPLYFILTVSDGSQFQEL